MSRKRRNTSSPESDYAPPLRVPKRSRSSSSEDESIAEWEDPQATKEQPRLNDAYGQHNAFPGLGEDGDELFYGPAADGIDYLRMVRSEAKAVPSLLVSDKPTRIEPTVEEGEHYEDDADEEAEVHGTFYHDGTYIAISTHTETAPKLPTIQVKYHCCLLDRFQHLRKLLQRSPPLSAVQALDERTPITLPQDSKVARDAWQGHILQYEPTPAQMASMDVDSVLELIKLLGDRINRFLQPESVESSSRVGAWVWAALAKCPERGAMGAEEIAELRAFASKVVGFQRGAANGDEEVREDGDDDKDDSFDELLSEAFAARERINGRNGVSGTHEVEGEAGDTALGSPSGRALADVVLTIVGEIYGQRDLLEMRGIWNTI